MKRENRKQKGKVGSLTWKILQVWGCGVGLGYDADVAINDLLETYCIAKGKAYFDDDLEMTVNQFTNSQKRDLLDRMADRLIDLMPDGYMVEFDWTQADEPVTISFL